VARGDIASQELVVANIGKTPIFIDGFGVTGGHFPSI
jgi:hypothetical protein